MKKSILLTIAIFCFFQVNYVFSQQSDPPELEWTQFFTSMSKLNSVKQTPDGGFVAAGRTSSGDAGIVKVNSAGDSLWMQTLEVGGVFAYFNSLDITDDGGFVAAGITMVGAVRNFYLVKTDSQGQFEDDYVSGGNLNEECFSVQQTWDGGYIMCGDKWDQFLNHWIYLVKLNPLCEFEWDSTLGAGDDYGKSVIQTSDGNFALTGYTYDAGDMRDKLYMAKVDSASGAPIWEYTYGYVGSAHEGHSLCEGADGSLYAAGNLTGYSAYCVKATGDGVFIDHWDYDNGNATYCEEIAKTDDGAVLAGRCTSLSGDFDLWLCGIDDFGSKQWGFEYDIDGVSNFCLSVQPSDDGGYVICGRSDYVQAPSITFIFKLIMPGTTEAANAISSQIPEELSLSSHPNPFNPTTNLEFSLLKTDFVSLKVYDVAGNLVATLFEGSKAAGRHQMVFNASALSSGVYFVRLTAGDLHVTHKLLLIK